MTTTLTTAQFKECLPTQFHGSLTQEVQDKINAALSNPDTADEIRNNMVGYTHVMTQGRFKLTSYVDAVKYVSFKLMGNTNLDAYRKTFPDKYTDMLSRNVTSKDISSYVSMYNKSKLVGLIMEQSMIPTHVLNQAVFQKAINTQAQIMSDMDVCSRDRVAAANSLITALKPPEKQKVELDIGVKEGSVIQELKEVTMNLAGQLQGAIGSGVRTVKDVSETPIVLEHEDD